MSRVFDALVDMDSPGREVIHCTDLDHAKKVSADAGYYWVYEYEHTPGDGIKPEEWVLVAEHYGEGNEWIRTPSDTPGGGM